MSYVIFFLLAKFCYDNNEKNGENILQDTDMVHGEASFGGMVGSAAI